MIVPRGVISLVIHLGGTGVVGIKVGRSASIVFIICVMICLNRVMAMLPRRMRLGMRRIGKHAKEYRKDDERAQHHEMPMGTGSRWQ